MRRFCVNCMRFEEEACKHEYISVPDKCVCDPGTWNLDKDIPPACQEYKGDGKQNCEICEHDKECHKA